MLSWSLVASLAFLVGLAIAGGAMLGLAWLAAAPEVSAARQVPPSYPVASAASPYSAARAESR